MSWLEKLQSLPIALEEKTISSAEIAALIAEERALVPKGPREFYLLQDANPLRFIIRYLALLEQNHIPILVPVETTPFQMQRLQARIEEMSPNSLENRSYACLTSGTTGEPKFSLHSIEGAWENALAHAQSLGINVHHNLVQALPVTHAFGIVCYLWTALATGCGLRLLTSFLTGGTWDRFVNEQSAVYLSPALARLLLKNSKPFAKVPAILSVGGGIFYADEFKNLQKRFAQTTVFVTYGFTEAGPRVSTERISDTFQNRSLGYPLSGINVKVLVDGELRTEGRGRLAIAGPSLQLNANSEDWRGEYLFSSDEVVLHADGRIEHVDRTDDLIKVGGVSIYPSDILHVVRQLYPREESLVLKQAHPVYGEIPVLVMEGKLVTEDVQKAIAPFLSPLQRPRQLLTMERFPRNSFGKIDRKALREKLT